MPVITFGAKAYHFSKSGANKFKSITRHNLQRLPKGSDLLISFGEIDCRQEEGFLKAAKDQNVGLDFLVEETVRKYVKWILDQNKFCSHRLYFLTVPAPVPSKRHGTDDNAKVAKVVNLFNQKLQAAVQDCTCSIIDIYAATKNEFGYSNGKHHIDSRHLGPSVLDFVDRELTTKHNFNLKN